MISLNAERTAASSAATERSTIRSALANGAEILRAAGINTAWLDAEVLLSEILNSQRAQLYLDRDLRLSPAVAKRYYSLLRRRSRREPVAYILGRKEFWSLNFWVTPDVLIPRPETERLVEVALECARQLPSEAPLRVLDLGTGSGVMAVCLAKELREAEVWAVELSAPALAVARVNVRSHGLEEKIHLLRGSMFEPLVGESFDLIVSNPPYVRTRELTELMPDVQDWEPVTALDGGPDGMSYYRQIAVHASKRLVHGGWIVVEIGAQMASEVSQMFAVAGDYAAVSVFQDYACKDRVIATRKLTEETGTKESLVG